MIPIPGASWRDLIIRSFERLLHLYPPRFRQEFSDEIFAVFVSRMGEAGGEGGRAWGAVAVHEIAGLLASVMRERWHERWIRKGKMMDAEDQISKGSGGNAILQTTLAPGSGALWVAGWILLTTAVFPVALFLATPLAIPYMWLTNLGVKAGLWPAGSSYSLSLEGLGFTTSMAIGMAVAQWLMLRNTLPRPGLWFGATAAGIWFAGVGVWWFNLMSVWQTLDSFTLIIVVLLIAGLALGVSQWLYARRFLRNASWIIPIDLVAATSILLLRPVVETYVDLWALLGLALPGIITGFGVWLLLRQSHLEATPAVQARTPPQRRWLKRLIWTVVMLVLLVPLYFASIWVFAASHIALAKNEGVYPTPEEALIAAYSRDIGEAHVISVEQVRTGPNWRDDRHPELRFGTATVTLDRIPPRFKKASFSGGSYILHVGGGWVFMPESAFPEFIVWVMELYHMEGLR